MYRLMFASVFSIILIYCLSMGCSSSTEMGLEHIGIDYFPLEVGKELVYQVDSVIYDTTGQGTLIDTTSSYLLERIVEKFQNSIGQNVFRIERYFKKNLSDPWQIQKIWSAELDSLRAIRTEDNFRFIKLVFPLVENSFWDGNQFIDKSTNVVVAGETVEIFKDWEYEVIRVDENEQIGTFAFNEVATISQADSENLIELRYSREKYAKGIGLVYKEMRILDTQNITESLPWEEKAQKGFILTQLLIDHN